jgi:predicted RNase H-like HicB family nuclease
MKLLSYIQRDPKTGVFVGVVPSIPGAYTQAETLEELYKNLKDVVGLCLSELAPEDRKTLLESEFVGLWTIEV